MLFQVVEQFMRGARTIGQLQFLQVTQLDEAGQPGRGQQRAAGQRQHLQISHRAQVLQPKVSHL